MRSPLRFLLLVFALSVPFWLLGALTDFEILPGLPLSALMIVCPLLAASILVCREEGPGGVRRLFTRSLDFRSVRPKAWYLPIVLLMPALTVLAYWLMRWTGRPLPAFELPVGPALAMLAAFFVAAIGEEAGWTGYAIDPMQERWGALAASLILGTATVLWHVVPLLQAHRAPDWIAWWALNAVGIRVLTVWIYNNTGRSVFAAVLFHDFVNLATYLFPVYSSHWEPGVIGPVTTVAAVIVALVWGPRTLTSPGSF